MLSPRRLDDGRRRRRHDHPQARACFRLFVTGLHLNTVYADPPGRVVFTSAIAAAAVAVVAAAVAIPPECPARRAAASATAAAVADAIATATVAIAAAAAASNARCPILASRAGNLHDLGHL